MTFGEKVRRLRTEKKISQTELGKLCGVSLRTIRNYEVDGRYPKQREVYNKLAEVLGCSTNYLLTEAEDQEIRSFTKDGVNALVEEVAELFRSTDLTDREKDDVMRRLQYAYWENKKEDA